MKKTLCFILFFSYQVNAFIPPVSTVLKEIFDGRKRAEGTELIFHHHILISGGEALDIEERVIATPSKQLFSWRVNGQSAPVTGILEKKVYRIAGGERKFNSHSALFLRYFSASSGEEYKNVLLAERFLKAEQLRQFKENFEPIGDPLSWDIKGNYIDHDSISLARVFGGIAIAAVGTDEPAIRKTVFFDKGLAGLRRIEWKENAELFAWNFDHYSKMAGEGVYPRKLFFTKDKLESISSELSLVRPLTARLLSELVKGWQRMGRGQSPTPPMEEALKNLLSYR